MQTVEKERQLDAIIEKQVAFAQKVETAKDKYEGLKAEIEMLRNETKPGTAEGSEMQWNASQTTTHNKQKTFSGQFKLSRGKSEEF